jgi:hypothetical protein
MRASSFSIDDNPFHVLHAAYRSSAVEIADLVEDAELDGNVEESALLKAQQILVTPKTRLISEVSWLPELSQLQISKVLELLTSADAQSILNAIDHFPELAKANIAAHLCGRKSATIDVVAILARTWDEIDSASVLAFLNENRRLAGFPNLEQSQLRDALDELRGLHAVASAVYVWSTDAPGELMNEIVERELERNFDGSFLSLLVKSYDSNSELALSSISEEFRYNIDIAKTAPKDLQIHVQRLSQLLANWDEINQPVQVYEQSRGHEEARSKQIYENIRELCLNLANEKGRYSEALELSEALLRTFPELESVAESLRGDISALESLAEQKKISDQLDPLIDACEKAKRDLPSIRKTLRSDGFSPRGQGIVANLVNKYNAAKSSLDDPSVAILVVRDLALHINNELKDSETAFRLIDGLLGSLSSHGRKTADVVDKLKDERSVLHKNWKMAEFERQSSNLGAMVKIIDEMLVYAGSKDKAELQQLKSKIQRRQTGKKIKYVIYASIAAFVGYLLISEEFNSPSSRTTYRPTTTGGSSLPAPPAATNSYQEDMPPIGSGRTLTRNQVRYCVFQGDRLDYIRPLTTTNSHIDRFNLLVDDFNRRCSSFRYTSGVLQAVEREAAARSSILQTEARRVVSSW